MNMDFLVELCKFLTTISSIVCVLWKAYKVFTKSIRDQVELSNQMQSQHFQSIEEHLKELDKGSLKRENSLEEMDKNIVSIKNEITGIKEDLKENTLQTYRDCLFNESLSREERIEVGYKYIELGGNGVGKKMVHKLEEEVYEEKMRIHDSHSIH